MPDFLTSRDEWFSYWDHPNHGGDGSGQLTRKQVVNALIKSFREFDKKHVDALVSEVWVDFDENKCGVIGMDVLMKPQFGFIDTVHMLMLWSR